VGKDQGGPRSLIPSRPYRLEFTTGADRQFRNLPKDVQERLTPHLDALLRNPRPPGIKKLKGADAYRLRVGDYRLIYEIRDKVLVVLVVSVGHRREVYR
jgi:mRNA interferase RelE/StbE